MTIGVTGATGHLGRLVIRGLKAKMPTGQLVALARSPQKATDLGVAVRQADYTRPSELNPALQGIETLLLISASEIGKRAAQHHNVIEAAKAAGVRQIVYTSLLHADISIIDLAAEHRQTEAELKASGIPCTILRNGWYLENYAGVIQGAVATGTLIGSAGEGKISSATRAEYADAAIAVLTTTGHHGKTYELAGDHAWTMADLAAEISRQTGKDIVYKNLPQAEYAAMLKAAGVPAGLDQIVAGWDVATSKGALFDGSRQLSQLIGRPIAPLAVALAPLLASGI